MLNTINLTKKETDSFSSILTVGCEYETLHYNCFLAAAVSCEVYAASLVSVKKVVVSLDWSMRTLTINYDLGDSFLAYEVATESSGRHSILYLGRIFYYCPSHGSWSMIFYYFN